MVSAFVAIFSGLSLLSSSDLSLIDIVLVALLIVSIVTLIAIVFNIRRGELSQKREVQIEQLKLGNMIVPTQPNVIRLDAEGVKGEFSDDIHAYNFNVRRFQGIKELQINLNLDAPWLIFTGNNGFGKTNILQAIARVLSPLQDQSRYEAVNPLNHNTLLLMNYQGQLHQLPSFEQQAKLSYRIMAYGASRLDMGSERSTKTYANCSSLFESQVLLANIEKEGLSRWYFKPSDREKFNDCVNKFKRLLPSLEDIIVDDQSEVWYIEKDDDGNPLPKVKFAQLAAGFQNIISMVGDIILKLNKPLAEYEANTLIDKPKAIVLIDEVELYLHPIWQKALPQTLSDLFPNITFIATTHSPMPLLGLPKGSGIYNVQRSAKDGITVKRIDDKIDINELQPNSILTSPIFDVEDIFAQGFDGDRRNKVTQHFNDNNIHDLMDKKINEFLTDEKEQALIERYKRKKSS